MIFYCCPDIQVRSGGVARLYRHVRLLHANGIEAAILHTLAGFFVEGEEEVPTRYLQIPCLREGDIVVLPEGHTYQMNLFKGLPIRKFGICLNWDYLYRSLYGGQDWRDFGIEAAIVVSPFIGRLVEWAMGIPFYVLDYSIDRRHYYDTDDHVAQVVYIKRKKGAIESLRGILSSRDPDYVDRIQWKALDGLPLRKYAAEIRRSQVFLSMSQAEGLTMSMFEAMASGCLVAGYDGVGGQQDLVASGPGRNAILSPCGDYVNLAYRLEPVMRGMLDGDMAPWKLLIENGKALTASHTEESEERSVVSFWTGVLNGRIVPEPPRPKVSRPL